MIYMLQAEQLEMPPSAMVAYKARAAPFPFQIVLTVGLQSMRQVKARCRSSCKTAFIYDNGGIFGKSEKAWKECHGLPESITYSIIREQTHFKPCILLPNFNQATRFGAQHILYYSGFSLNLQRGHIPRIQLPRNQLSGDAI